MFVWSMKTTRPRLAACGLVLVLLLTALVVTGRREMRPRNVSAAGDDAKRVAYLQEKGYDVTPRWTDVREIVVPDVEAVPAAYRGERIKCFTYATAAGQTVCLYEWKGNIIGTSEGNVYGTIG